MGKPRARTPRPKSQISTQQQAFLSKQMKEKFSDLTIFKLWHGKK